MRIDSEKIVATLPKGVSIIARTQTVLVCNQREVHLVQFRPKVGVIGSVDSKLVVVTYHEKDSMLSHSLQEATLPVEEALTLFEVYKAYFPRIIDGRRVGLRWSDKIPAQPRAS